MAEAKIVGVRTRKDGSTFTLDLSGIANDSWQIISIMWSNNTVNLTTPAGWTVLLPMETTGTRRNIVYGRKRVAGDPTSVQIAMSANAQIATTLLWGTGNWENRVVGASRVRSTIGNSGSRTQNIAPSLNAPAKSLVIAITNEATNARVLADEISAVSPTSWARYNYLGQPDATANNIETTGIYWNAFQNAGATGDVTFTYTSAQDSNGWAAQIAIPGDSVTPPAPPPGTLTFISNVAAEGRIIHIAGKASLDTRDVLFEIDGVGGSGSGIDSYGYFHLNVPTTWANENYTWSLYIDDVLRRTGTVKSLPETLPETRFVWGSCFDAYTSGVFSLIDARDPSFIVELGDWGYQYISGGANGNTSPPDEATYMAHREPVLSAALPQGLFSKYPTSYTYSDCDGGGSNADSTIGGLATGGVQAGYRRQMAHPTLPLSDCGARSWVIGKIRFVQTDETTLASARGSADNSSKTKLGASQKAWFMSQIDEAVAAGQSIVWFGDGPWANPPAVGTHNDWSAYNTERVELGNHIANSGVKIVRLHGDTHSLFADDGTNNPYGGFPFASAAPLHTTANVFSRPVTHGSWPTVQTNSSRQYGVGTFTEADGSVTLTIRGFSSTNSAPTEVERFNMVMDMTPQSAPSTQPWANLYIGDTPAAAMYVGDMKVWP